MSLHQNHLFVCLFDILVQARKPQNMTTTEQKNEEIHFFIAGKYQNLAYEFMNSHSTQ